MDSLMAADSFAYTTFIPTQHFTTRDRELLQLVNIVFLSGPMAFFGIIGNVINLIVFYQQGLNTNTNIGFFALAIADLITLIYQAAWAVLASLVFGGIHMNIEYVSVQFAILALPKEGFARNSCLITVLITAERCLCIVFPQTVKEMITPKGARLVIVSIYLGTFLSGLPILMNYRANWKFDKEMNSTILSIDFTGSSHLLQKVIYFIHAVSLIVSVGAVLVFTLILVLKLKQTSAWRVTAHIQQKDFLSKRDSSVMSMVVLIASILIVCFTPSVVLCIATFAEPEFS
ncbi:unnamed protein product, partial [Candidula unifasciata]